jgi:hypothetical protein
MKHLDFMIIGAQKAGTTSLFKYLERHERIYLPAEKEIPFFTRDGRFDKGWLNLARVYYRGASEDLLWGKATPHYLADPRAPGRIRQMMPDVKLIALLRHPLERAISHYKMAVRRGDDTRNLEQAFSELLEPTEAEAARHLTSERRHQSRLYLSWSEYGRQLSLYREYFPPEQMLVTFTEDLATQPQATLDGIMRFLGLPEGFTPVNLGRFYHVGGTDRRVPWLSSAWVHRLLKQVPSRWGARLRYWLEIWDVDPDSGRTIVASSNLRDRLLHFFQPDVRCLERLVGRPTPWEGLGGHGHDSCSNGS